MTEPLFIEPGDLGFEKNAMEARLSDSADTWPQEVLQEAHKKHPYLGKFDVSPVMQEVDGERGFGLGFLTVRGRTNRPETPAGMAMAFQAGVKTCKIPIIITDSTLKELDVFIDSKGDPRPLSEARMREALFRPQLFDTTGKSPAATLIGEDMAPPGRGRPGTWPTEVSKPKTSSVKPEFLMSAIESTISQSDLDKVTTELNGNQKLASALLTNDATMPFMQHLAQVEPISADDVGSAVTSSITPDVMMMTRDDEGGYHLKMANSQMFYPREVVGDRFAMMKIADEDMIQATEANGVAVVHRDPVVRDALDDERVEQVTRFGEYRVKDTNGREHMGWVFPSVLNFNGTALPMAVFTNGSVSAIQESIVGSFVGRGNNIIKGKPEGHGFFYRTTDSGGAIAFVPCEVKTTASDNVGPYFIVETALGAPAKLRPVPGLKEIAEVSDGEYGIPADVQWAPLGENALPMVSDPTLFVKTSSVSDHRSTIRIISDGRTWSIQGTPLSKIAYDQRELLDAPDALFMTCSLGVEPQLAMRGLVKAAQAGEVEFKGCRPITLPVEKLAEARTRAASLLAALPDKHLLLKEAAGLEDMNTVDKVLSLGFLNAENVSTFVNYIPDFEKTIQRLADILIASRLGMSDVPEIAAKNAMERLEDVTRGLKELMYRKVEA